MRPYADGLSGQVPSALLAALPPPLAAALAGHSNIYALELLQGLVTPSIVPGSTYFQSGQGIADNYRLQQTSYSIFGNADLDVTDRLTLTGGLGYLHDRKKAVSNVVLTDRFSALNLQNVPQFGLLGLPPNLYGALGGLQFYYPDTTNHAPVNFPNANESGDPRRQQADEGVSRGVRLRPRDRLRELVDRLEGGRVQPVVGQPAAGRQRHRPHGGAGGRDAVRGRDQVAVPARLRDARRLRPGHQGLPVERVHRHRLRARQRRQGVDARRRARHARTRRSSGSR